MAYDIESMERWSGDSRSVTLHSLVHRLRVELAVRTSNPGFPSRPEKWRVRGFSAAWETGLAFGWRGKEYQSVDSPVQRGGPGRRITTWPGSCSPPFSF